MGKNRATRRRSFSRREHTEAERRRRPRRPDDRFDVEAAYAAERDPVESPDDYVDDVPSGSCLCHDAGGCPDEFTDAYGYGPLAW